MEKNFNLKEDFAAASHAGVMAPAMGFDDAYVSGFYPEPSFQSVLQPMSLTLVNYSPYDGGVSFHSQSQMPVVASSSPTTYGFGSEGFPKMETWCHGEVLDQKLKLSKQETLNTKDIAFELLKLNSAAESDTACTEPLINFLAPSPSINPSLNIVDGSDFTGHFSHLPLQKSPEPPQPQTSFRNKNIFHFHPTESSSSSFSKNQMNSALMRMKRSAAYRQRSAGKARQRRERISDKTRCLEKLLPWNKRMDMATMLEEAYKYVKFLRAQIRVLQSMPILGITSENPNPKDFGSSGDVYGVLAKLNRQQLLEVVVNSPAAQTMLYSRGCCVYSMEQLFLLKKMVEKAAAEQVFFPSVQY